MTNKTKTSSNEIMIIDENTIKDKIYTIRGIQVMLDSDIAKYFDVSTANLNRAMKRNIDRFPKEFCFKLNYDEASRFQIGTLNTSGNKRGRNIKYLPYVYSEQGIAMLTSCLHSKRAVEASIYIMNAFVYMRHYIIKHNSLSKPYDNLYELTLDNTSRIKQIENTMITRNDLSDIMSLFDSGVNNEEILILDGQPFKADIVFQDILAKANKNIIIIDDYINIKTLQHLRFINRKIPITIISNNKNKTLTLAEYNDFIKQFPHISIIFLKSNNKIHDRFIVLNYKYKNQLLFHLGSSIKDGGNKLTVINRLNTNDLLNEVIENYFINNQELILI